MKQPPTNAFCSIVTLNYLAYAKTLNESLKASGNTEPYYVLIADYRSEYQDLVKASGLNIITVQQLNIAELDELIEKYSAFEFSNILKPFFVKWLLKNHSEINYLVFLDSDIYVYDTFSDIYKYLDSHPEYSALLTPHMISKKIKEEYLKRTDYNIEQSHFGYGLYNSGMLVYKNDERVVKYLDWHINKCSRYGFNMTDLHLFNEQKVLDMAPLTFDFVGIYSNMGYNVAPWNYYPNMMRKDNNKYFVEDQPLVFFHFSQVHKHDPANSLYYEVSDKDKEIYFKLISDYRERLKFNDSGQASLIPYGFQEKYKPPTSFPVSSPLIDRLKQDVTEALHSVATIAGERDKLKLQIEHVHQQLSSIYSSKSWKLTYLLRKSLDYIKGIRK
ncbi:MAG: hypothetical protein KW793_01175 [Candidatus Doudnabacteria bacterium]|nr:hypothetical protein [Candidatus Doudnabacteria bacterium]